MSKGNFEGRLAEFAQRASLGELQEAAAFTHVIPGTVLSWLTDGAPPKGEPHIRMMYYLEQKGLPPEELNSLPEPARQLGQFISAEVIGLDEAMQRLGYATMKDLYRLLHGAELTAVRANKLDAVLADCRSRWPSTRSTTQVKPLGDVIKASVEAPTPQPEKTAVATQRLDFSIEHLAGVLLTTTALVESMILSDETKLATAVEVAGTPRVTDLVSYLHNFVAN